MNKKEFWQRIWIHVEKRKPPETEDPVLIWNPFWKEALVMEAKIARYGALAMEQERDISPDRIFNKWCFIYPPEDKHEKKKRKTRLRRNR